MLAIVGDGDVIVLAIRVDDEASSASIPWISTMACSMSRGGQGSGLGFRVRVRVQSLGLAFRVQVGVQG